MLHTTYNMYKENSGNNVHQIRIKQKLTRKEVASSSNMPYTSYCEIEASKTTPVFIEPHRRGQKKPFLDKLLNVLNTTFQEAFPNHTYLLPTSKPYQEAFYQEILTLPSNSSPEEILEHKEQVLELINIISQLPPEEKHIINERIFKNSSYQTLETKYGYTTQALNHLIFRGMHTILSHYYPNKHEYRINAILRHI